MLNKEIIHLGYMNYYNYLSNYNNNILKLKKLF